MKCAPVKIAVAGTGFGRKVALPVYRKIEELEGSGISSPEVIYGGTVTPENVGQFAALEILDGVGATRAGLNAPDFLALVDQII